MQNVVFDKKYNNMEYRRVGSSGLWISEISLGTWLNFNNASSAKQLIHSCFRSGINYFDTADLYGQLPGWAESFLGESLYGHTRSSYVLSTKVYSQTGRSINEKGLSRKHIFEACNSSLSRLRTDYIDIYFCHRYDPLVELEEVFDTMADLKTRGKILYVGISMWPADKIKEAVYWSKRKNVQLIANQVEYNILKSPEKEVLDICSDNGIGLIAYSPLAQGCLTGKYRDDRNIEARLYKKGQNHWINKLLAENNNMVRLKQYVELLDINNCDGIQIALKWVLGRSSVCSALCGARTEQQLIEIINAYDSMTNCKIDWVENI